MSDKNMESFSQWRYRPRRRIIKPCLDYSQMLLREEEQALKRALYVSLRDTKSGNDGSSPSGKDNSEKVSDSSVSTTSSVSESKQMKKRKCIKPLDLKNVPKRQKEVLKQKGNEMDCENPDLNTLSSSRFESLGGSLCQELDASNNIKGQDVSARSSISKRTRRQLKVQRKFAHLQPYSPSSLLLQKLGTSSGLRPKTEDFIRFLCLRGTASLPKELEFFNSPALPQSPLSSDDDEYLPVSPFFKRQVDGSSAINKSDFYGSYRRQLEYNFSDAFSSNEPSMDIDKSTSTHTLSSTSYDNDSAPLSWVPSENLITSNSRSSTPAMEDVCDDENQQKLSVEIRKERCKGEHAEEVAAQKEEFAAMRDDSSQEADFEKQNSSSLDLSGPLDIKKSSPISTKSGFQNKHKVKGSRIDIKVFENELESAPIFRPMEQEFKDPMKYIRKIAPFIMKYGMCILVPPVGWQPSSNVSDDIRFGTRIQHIHRMRNRNPETTKFLTYLHRCLGETSDLMEAIPQIGSCEVDLLHMSKAFQNFGGVAKVNTPRKWHRIADSLHIPKAAQGRITKLQDIYYKYVLPYDILSSYEKERIKEEAENDAEGLLLQEPESKGRSASVSSFHRIASNAQEMYGRGQKSTCALEDDFWNSIAVGKRHVAALSGDIDTMNYESSFHVGRSKSGWNVSSLPQSQGSLLRYLGVVPGLTTSSLKFSSVFTTSQWQRHDDNLFKIEYLHAGASRVWYAVPSHMETVFHEKVESLMPGLKLADSEIRKFLISPLELNSDKCRVSRAVQKEGQFVLCLPNVYHCVFSSGYCLTESCYFAQIDWLQSRIDKETSIIKPTRTFPAEMIILNYAKSVVQKSKRTEHIALILQLTEAIRTVTITLEQKLSVAGVQKSIDVPHGQNKRFAVDWDVCSGCGRPLYPLIVWSDSHFYCADHALRALENNCGAIDSSCKMFRYWVDEQLDILIVGLQKLKTRDSL